MLCCAYCFVSPLAPPRTCGGIGIGIGAFGIGGGTGIGTTYFDDGRSGSAVGCLPAPLRFGPAKKPAGLPSSPPNATAKATAALGRGMQAKTHPKGPGSVLARFYWWN